MRALGGSGELHPDDLFGHVLAAGECAETAETPGNTGLKSDARLFAVIAHVNTGFDLFADHMGGCDLHLTSPLGGIDWLAGFLADQQV